MKRRNTIDVTRIVKCPACGAVVHLTAPGAFPIHSDARHESGEVVCHLSQTPGQHISRESAFWKTEMGASLLAHMGHMLDIIAKENMLALAVLQKQQLEDAKKREEEN